MVNKRKVPSITYRTLLRKYNVTSIGYLRIDLEGMDFVLLQQVYAYGQETGTWPETIQFEQQGSVPMWNQIRFQFYQKYKFNAISSALLGSRTPQVRGSVEDLSVGLGPPTP
eukprot:GEMP01084825.1.p1 GENE.GEMP01084825.1~~GEMP01084825.1.p1  ORF type:complete len:112 (+),score=19.01 GEMP01084825.1:549-884(+)